MNCGAVLISDVAPASSRHGAAKMAALRSDWDSTRIAVLVSFAGHGLPGDGLIGDL